MNKPPIALWPLVVLCALAWTCPSTAPAQQDDFSEMAPSDSGPDTADFDFKMKLDPGVVMNIALSSIGNKQDPTAGDEVNPAPHVVQILTIRRDIRSGIVGIRTEFSDNRPPSEMFYAGGWCAYDDPKKGLNVRRPDIEGLLFPMQKYHFPELMWALPATREPDPKVEEGQPKIHRYSEDGKVLEVDAATLLPLRFVDGQNEWTYSFAPSGKEFVVPEGIKAALMRVLQKGKRK